MRRALIVGLIVIAMALCVALGLRFRRRLRLDAKLGDIEWVIVDCHTTSLARPWIAKLTPERNAKLVEELIAAVRGAKPGHATKSEGDCFLVFKMKSRGIQAFNFVAWDGEPQVEIKPGFFSSSLPKLLRRIEVRQIGWDLDDSLPDVRARQIVVRDDGPRPASFRPDSPAFAALSSAAAEVLKTVDPRVCIQDMPEADPRESIKYGGKIQFIATLEKPVEIKKLIVQWEPGTEVANVKYVSFPSSVFTILTGEGTQITWLDYVSFADSSDEGCWHGWSLWEEAEVARSMGKPGPQQAFDRLLEVYNGLVGRGAPLASH